MIKQNRLLQEIMTCKNRNALIITVWGLFLTWCSFSCINILIKMPVHLIFETVIKHTVPVQTSSRCKGNCPRVASHSPPCVSGFMIDVFINSVVRKREREWSRCLQLHTRLQGGVLYRGGGVLCLCALGVLGVMGWAEEATVGRDGSRELGGLSYNLKEPLL